MLTDRAHNLSAKAQTSEGKEALDYSRLAWDELFDKCQPTKAEFSEFATLLVLPSDVLWELILCVPQWDNSQKQLDADNKYHTTVSRVKSDAK